MLVDGMSDKLFFYDLDGNFKSIHSIRYFQTENTLCLRDSVFLHISAPSQNFGNEGLYGYALVLSKGNENEYCMLLSNKAKSIALPMLLCTEEDVEGNHSTASGKVDAKQLFYLMTRGLSYKEAVKLIVKANFQKIIDRINDEELRNVILKEIDKKLD